MKQNKLYGNISKLNLKSDINSRFDIKYKFKTDDIMRRVDS